MRYLLDIKLFSLALSFKIQRINYIPIDLGLMEAYFCMVSKNRLLTHFWTQPAIYCRTDWLKATALHVALSAPLPPIRSSHYSTLSPTGRLCTLQLLLSSSCPVATNKDAALFQSGHIYKWVSKVKPSECEDCDKGSSADNKADWCSWWRCALKGSTCCLRRSAECLCIWKVIKVATTMEQAEEVWVLLLSDMYSSLKQTEPGQMHQQIESSGGPLSTKPVPGLISNQFFGISQ